MKARRIRTLLLDRLDVVRAQEKSALALDADAIHDMRVAARRLRAALGVLARDSRQVADDVRALQDALGDVRDLQLLRAWIVQHHPASTKTSRLLTKGLRRAERALPTAIRRWQAMAPGLEELLSEVEPRTSRKVRSRVKRRWSQFHDCERAARDAGFEPAPAHRLRIATKKLRYECEAAKFVLGKAGARLLKRLEPLQEALGELHDTDVRLELLGRDDALDTLVAPERRRREHCAEQARKAARRIVDRGMPRR